MKRRSTTAPAGRLPTMKDIARLVGVHQSTVSLALRDRPEIPPATRRRIRAAALHLGYHPDPVLDAFNLHRLAHQPLRSAPAIAFLHDAPLDATAAGAAGRSEVYRGARETAEKLGFVLDHFLVGANGVTVPRLNRILKARNIDGAILCSLAPETAELPLDWARLSGLKIESFHVRPAFDVIAPDHLQASRLAVARLHALGYRRIGLAVGRREDARVLQLFRSGYLVEQSTHPGMPGIEPCIFDDAPLAAPAASIAAWVRCSRLDAVISPSNELPAWLEAEGLSAPRDLAFASLDRFGEGDAIAGIDAGHALVGRTAVELVAMRRRINQRGAADETSFTLFPGSWHDGATAPRR